MGCFLLGDILTSGKHAHCMLAFGFVQYQQIGIKINRLCSRISPSRT
jgi:hypothetical protein